jgi:predicted nuclease with TOPRIM domain
MSGITNMKTIMAVSVFCLGLGIAQPQKACAAEPTLMSLFAEIDTIEMSDDIITVQYGENRQEQRAQRQQNMQERRAKMEERIDGLPPEEQEAMRAKMQERKAKMDDVRAELESLPPEERKARMKEIREEMKAGQAERQGEFQKRFEERWDTASEAERAAFCDKAAGRCDDGGKKACETVRSRCSE